MPPVGGAFEAGAGVLAPVAGVLLAFKDVFKLDEVGVVDSINFSVTYVVVFILYKKKT